eukprot:Rhum_TRINITY_DN25086_c0_g1::Rhum_TRINITY_DN25086_c0_g1_i1::g.181149::m.181149
MAAREEALVESETSSPSPASASPTLTPSSGKAGVKQVDPQLDIPALAVHTLGSDERPSFQKPDAMMQPGKVAIPTLSLRQFTNAVPSTLPVSSPLQSHEAGQAFRPKIPIPALAIPTPSAVPLTPPAPTSSSTSSSSTHSSTPPPQAGGSDNKDAASEGNGQPCAGGRRSTRNSVVSGAGAKVGGDLADDEALDMQERLKRALERERLLRAALQQSSENTAVWMRISEERWGDALRQMMVEGTTGVPTSTAKPTPMKIPKLNFPCKANTAPYIPSLQLHHALSIQHSQQFSGRSQQTSSRALETPHSAMSSDRTHHTYSIGDSPELPVPDFLTGASGGEKPGAAGKPSVPFLRLSALTASSNVSLSHRMKEAAAQASVCVSRPASRSITSPPPMSSTPSPASPSILSPVMMLRPPGGGAHYDASAGANNGAVGCGEGLLSERSRSAGGSARTHDSGYVEV